MISALAKKSSCLSSPLPQRGERVRVRGAVVSFRFAY